MNKGKKTTAARRLIAVLETARATGNPNMQAREIWALVFGLNQDDGIGICRQLVVLADLVKEIELQIKSVLETDHDTYLAGFDHLLVGLSPLNLSQNRSTAIEQYFTPERIARLQFCDLALMSTYGEESIGPDDLGVIDQAAKELFDMVRASDMNARLRTVLLDAIERVRRSIAMYQIHGAKGIRESLQILVGVAVLERDALKQTTVAAPDLLDRYGKLVFALDNRAKLALPPAPPDPTPISPPPRIDSLRPAALASLNSALGGSTFTPSIDALDIYRQYVDRCRTALDSEKAVRPGVNSGYESVKARQVRYRGGGPQRVFSASTPPPPPSSFFHHPGRRPDS